MLDYAIRNAESSDLKTIQNLSQEFIEQENKIVKGEYTYGCVGISRENMIKLLSMIDSNTRIRIEE